MAGWAWREAGTREVVPRDPQLGIGRKPAPAPSSRPIAFLPLWPPGPRGATQPRGCAFRVTARRSRTRPARRFFPVSVQVSTCRTETRPTPRRRDLAGVWVGVPASSTAGPALHHLHLPAAELVSRPPRPGPSPYRESRLS